MGRLIRICVLVLVLWSLTGCGWGTENQSSQVFDINLSPLGNNMKVVSLTSDAYYYSQKQAEVAKHLFELVNSGLYDIVSIQTFYSDTYLTAAQVTYNYGVAGEGNRIKLALLVSTKQNVDEKQSFVQPLFEEVLRDPDREIVKSSPVYDRGYLVAAEVYYKDR